MTMEYDTMSFGKAFAAARKAKGSGKTFTWKGKSYSTNTKEEGLGSKKASTKASAKMDKSPRPYTRGDKEATEKEKDRLVAAEYRRATAKSGAARSVKGKVLPKPRVNSKPPEGF